MDFTITSNKGTWGVMNINSIMITKQFIIYITLKLKQLRGSVGKAHIHVGYIFLNSNEEIVVRNPKYKIYFFIIYSFSSCLKCVILQFIHISHLSKSLSSILYLHGFRGVRTAFSESALVRNIVLFDMPVSLLAPSL